MTDAQIKNVAEQIEMLLYQDGVPYDVAASALCMAMKRVLTPGRGIEEVLTDRERIANLARQFREYDGIDIAELLIAATEVRVRKMGDRHPGDRPRRGGPGDGRRRRRGRAAPQPVSDRHRGAAVDVGSVVGAARSPRPGLDRERLT